MDKQVILLIMEFLIRLFVLLLLPKIYKWIKQHNLEKAIKDAVWAAEQLFKKNDPTGEKRKAFVQEYILERFKISKDELNILIEAFVKELNLIQEG